MAMRTPGDNQSQHCSLLPWCLRGTRETQAGCKEAEETAYLKQTPLQEEDPPLRRSSDSWPGCSAQQWVAAAALWGVGHTLILKQRRKKSTDECCHLSLVLHSRERQSWQLRFQHTLNYCHCDDSMFHSLRCIVGGYFCRSTSALLQAYSLSHYQKLLQHSYKIQTVGFKCVWQSGALTTVCGYWQAQQF